MLYQQFTGSPRFMAGENVHCVTAATTASSAARPSVDPRSRLTRCGCPVRDTSTRATTIFFCAAAATLAGSRGSTRFAMRGGWSTSPDSYSRPVSVAAGRAVSGATDGEGAGAGNSGTEVRATAGSTRSVDTSAWRAGARGVTRAFAFGLTTARGGAIAELRLAATTFVSGAVSVGDGVAAGVD